MATKANKKQQSLDKYFCKYGTDCYQKNTEHRKRFRHLSPKPNEEAGDEKFGVSPRKSPKKTVGSTNDKKLGVSPRKIPKKAVGNTNDEKLGVFPRKSPKKAVRNTNDEKLGASPRKSPKKAVGNTNDEKLGVFPRKSPKKVVGNTNAKDCAVALNSCGETESSSEEMEKLPRSISPVNMKDNIKENFLVDMPTDFYDLWDFCQTIKKKDPSEAFSELGLHLVGPYDVLSKKITNQDLASADDILCHWRYYYDPPEFQTVIKKDGDEGYHIGYFRDDPKEMPFGLASNSAKLGPKMKLVGDNIFCAINSEIRSCIKKLKTTKLAKEKYQRMLADLVKFAKNKNYSLEVPTPQTKKRDKNVVSKTFHGLGIVVPYDKKRQLGYRELPEDDATLKAILKKISNCEEDSAKLIAREPLDLILTNLQFANDEGDCGMGLELGIDLFCFGDPYLDSDIKFVLTLAYDLLGRPEFGRILQAHLKNRRKGDKLSVKKL